MIYLLWISCVHNGFTHAVRYQYCTLSKLFSVDMELFIHLCHLNDISVDMQLFIHLCHLNDIYSGIKLCYYLVLVHVSATTTV